jgi:hypothetical protein
MKDRTMTTRNSTWIGICSALAVALLLGWGCSKNDQDENQAGPGGPGGTPDCGFKECGLKAGPKDALVKVVAFYPGGHEDTIAAVNGLLKAFPEDVSIQFVDWRHPEGIKDREAAGLGCAGVTINGKNAYDINVDGKVLKVLFERGIGGEWTGEDLTAAVKQEIATLKEK